MATCMSLAEGRRKELPFIYNTYTILYALNMNVTCSVSREDGSESTIEHQAHKQHANTAAGTGRCLFIQPLT